MKRLIAIGLAAAMVLTLAGTAFASQAVTGNGSPSGSHFTLNIIGVSNPKNVNMDQGSGNVIFVQLGSNEEGLDKHTQINLTEGDDFAVLDKNGTDGEAEFQLPPPGVDAYVIGDSTGKDTTTDYSVFVRPLGKPGGWSTITTCADVLDSTFGGLLSGTDTKVLNSTDYYGGYASIEQVGEDITFRTKGKSLFTNVTAQLTTIVFEVQVTSTTGDVYTTYVRVPIFDESLQGEYWDYDNNGLKVLQVRFYPGVPSDLTEWDSPYN